MEKIVTNNVRIQIINDGRLLNQGTNLKKMCLEANGNEVTRNYQAMDYLCDDHYAVCDLIITNNTSCYLKDFNSETEREEKIVKASYKWGVIRVNRDLDGKIIPYMEELVVPYLFAEQRKGNLNTIIGEYNGKYIYLDLDADSELYKNTITPLIDYAEPFNVKYNGFAECSINGTTGYFPRNCIKRYTLQPKDLLTSQQASSLSSYLYDGNGNLSIDSIMAYKNLTGSNPREQRSKILKKKGSV